MFTVSILAQKGGVGKSTIVRTLAVLASRAGLAGIIDADPQATTSSWQMRRRATASPRGGAGEVPAVSAVASAELLRAAVGDARDEGYDWLFVDTPAGVSSLPATAAEVADLILIPCIPSVDDMEAMGPTVKLARSVGKPAYFLINRGRSKAINDECALSLTSAYGLPAVNTHLSTRLPVADAAIEGLVISELDGKDASITKGKEEFAALWQWLQKQNSQLASEAMSARSISMTAAEVRAHG